MSVDNNGQCRRRPKCDTRTPTHEANAANERCDWGSNRLTYELGPDGVEVGMGAGAWYGMKSGKSYERLATTCCNCSMLQVAR
ncbi:hypothetical protein ACLKA7_008506 [Drosophila subpalustris]